MRLYLIGIMLTISMLLIVVGAQADSYTFPRDDGSHFIFETSWENSYSKNQYDSNIVWGEHNFSVYNINPVYVQFKKLAMDGNDCYNNDSWKVNISLFKENKVINTIEVGNERSAILEIDTNIIYTLAVFIEYNKTMPTKNYSAIVQMNVVGDNLDSPHYFFEYINYEYIVDEQDIKEEKTEQGMEILVILLTLSILSVIVVFLYRQKFKYYINLYIKKDK